MLKENTEEELVHKKFERLPEMVDFHEFARLLRLDENNQAAQHLFKIHDKVDKIRNAN